MPCNRKKSWVSSRVGRAFCNLSSSRETGLSFTKRKSKIAQTQGEESREEAALGLASSFFRAERASERSDDANKAKKRINFKSQNLALLVICEYSFYQLTFDPLEVI